MRIEMDKSISFTMHLFKEGDVFVAYVPELDLSSCGDTAEVARRNIRDAVQGFLETSERMGTLSEILEEAGYRREGEDWQPPEFVSLDRVTVSLHS
jgi:predicted RNase H-like HicB family nuclease